MRRLALILVLVVAAPHAGAQRPRISGRSPAVPPQYRALYDAIDAGLDKWRAYLDSRDLVRGHDVVYGAEILPANTNRGAALLEPQALAGVRMYLDRLAAMGIEGASISIGYPMLDPSFPRSDEYLAFYADVAREVRSRGMRLHVETGVMFANTPFSDLEIDFSSLTIAKLVAGKRVMTQRILQQMQPDFLGIGGEPDTEAALTGLDELNDPDVYASVIEQVIDGLDRGNTAIGAGVGTWSPLRFAQRLADIEELDAITIHIYPIWKMPIENATLIPAVARAKGKRITLDEAWLYKAAQGEATSVAANEAIFRRDVFDFWAPVDNEFLTAISRLAQVEGIDYVSPFWTTYLFAQIRWEPAAEEWSYAEIVQRVNEAAVRNLVAGRLTPIGEHYKAIIAAQPVDVLIYNIHVGKDASGVDNLDRVATLIRESGADIVLLQEVDRKTTRSGGVDQLETLMQRTGMHGVFAKSLDYQGGEYGIATLSRWPIDRHETIPLRTDPPQPRAGGSVEPRVALLVRTNGLTVLNTHFDASREETWRLQEAEQLRTIEAHIAGGDFNAEPGSGVHQLMGDARYRDAWRECGDGAGLTFSAAQPVKRIDYLWMRGGIECTSANVIDTDASDHRPLLVTIQP